MATKKELEVELREKKRELNEKITEVEEYEKRRIKQGEKIEQLTASGKEKDLDIIRKIDMIASREVRITKLETRLCEKQERLNNSWDKKQADEVICMLLENLVSSGVIDSG